MTADVLPERDRAVLLCSAWVEGPDRPPPASLKELGKLLEVLGVDPVARLGLPSSAESLLSGDSPEGQGVRQVLQQQAAGAPTAWLVFDGELSPALEQQLAEHFDCPVLGRTEVILRVLAQRASTRVAQLEVELARMNYELLHWSERSQADDVSDLSGVRVPGNLNLNRQRQRMRIAEVRREIERESLAQGRKREAGSSKVALVGYTSAGRSTLLKALTTPDGIAPSFVALGQTLPAGTEGSERIVVSDTVAVLRFLPAHLLSSFQSTLQAALDADLLLIVVDAADVDWQPQLEATRQMLQQVGAADVPAWLFFNKLDRVSPDRLEALRSRFPEARFGSAQDLGDIESLKHDLRRFFAEEYAEATLEVPFGSEELLGEMAAKARVLNHGFSATGARVTLRARRAQLEQWRERLGADPAAGTRAR